MQIALRRVRSEAPLMIPYEITEDQFNECLFAGLLDDLRADLFHAVCHCEFHRLWQDPAFCGVMQAKCIFVAWTRLIKESYYAI